MSISINKVLIKSPDSDKDSLKSNSLKILQQKKEKERERGGERENRKSKERIREEEEESREERTRSSVPKKVGFFEARSFKKIGGV